MKMNHLQQLQKLLTQNFSNYYIMTLVVNRVRTVPSVKLIKGQIVTCALTPLIVCPFSTLLCLVIPSIFHRPKRYLYEHFFWQLTVQSRGLLLY